MVCSSSLTRVYLLSVMSRDIPQRRMPQSRAAHIIFVGRLHVVMAVRGAWPLKYSANSSSFKSPST